MQAGDHRFAYCCGAAGRSIDDGPVNGGRLRRSEDRRPPHGIRIRRSPIFAALLYPSARFWNRRMAQILTRTAVDDAHSPPLVITSFFMPWARNRLTRGARSAREIHAGMHSGTFANITVALFCSRPRCVVRSWRPGGVCTTVLPLGLSGRQMLPVLSSLHLCAWWSAGFLASLLLAASNPGPPVCLARSGALA